MTLFVTVENRFRRCALLLPARAFSFLLSMQFALTLENGETLSSLTKSNLESAILELQSDVTLPTRKNELLALLTSLVKNELGRRSTFGVLPDWRTITSLNVAALRVAILERNGSTVGTKAVLCRELERLNREALGLSPRLPQPLPPPAPFAQQSPLGHFAAQKAATMALGVAPQANYDTFSLSSETPDDELADPPRSAGCERWTNARGKQLVVSSFRQTPRRHCCTITGGTSRFVQVRVV